MRAKFLSVIMLGCFITQSYAQQDTMLMVKLPTVDVKAARNWDNDTVRYNYNQTKYYVKTILPYLNEATKLFNDLDATLNNHKLSTKERKAFIDSKEDALRDNFENEVKKLNVTQGVLLVKLIGRQTGVNLYTMLREFKNPLVAIKWQTWSRLHGMNLNTIYNPDDEPMLEHIMDDLDYPLPAIYVGRETAATLQR